MEMKKKSIVFILPSTHAGGGIRVIITLVNGLDNAGYNVYLYVYSDDGETRYKINDGVHVEHFKEPGNRKFLRVVGLFSIIRKINKKHINDTIFITDQFAVIFSNLIRTNNIYRYVQADDYSSYDDLHILKFNFLLKLFKKQLIKINQNSQSKVLFVSNYVREQYLLHGGRKENDRILNAPIAEGFYPLGIRRKNECNICIIGRIHKDKGFSDFIEAVKQLKNRNNINNIYVITPDNLEQYDTTGMKLLYANSDSEMNEIYNMSHIFISTGRNEGYGLPGLEAMATGSACILCDNGGVREYAEDGHNCILYKAMDIPALANSIDWLISDKNAQTRFGKAGLVTASRYRESAFVDSFIEFLQEDGII